MITGRTGHQEVARIHFNPKVINYDELLQILWHAHNPTTLECKQGNDVGTQYRSVIYYHNEEQKGIAEASKEAVDATDLWEDPIITTIEPANYYVAENYHQDYFENNPTAGYCSFVIAPKFRNSKKNLLAVLKRRQFIIVSLNQNFTHKLRTV